MSEQEVDPYDKGREAMDALFEVLEGEIVQDVRITKKGIQYHGVEILVSEYPIQELEVVPRYVEIDGELVGLSDLEDGEEEWLEQPRLVDVDTVDTSNGHYLSLSFQTE